MYPVRKPNVKFSLGVYSVVFALTYSKILISKRFCSLFQDSNLSVKLINLETSIKFLVWKIIQKSVSLAALLKTSKVNHN